MLKLGVSGGGASFTLSKGWRASFTLSNLQNNLCALFYTFPPPRSLIPRFSFILYLIFFIISPKEQQFFDLFFPFFLSSPYEGESMTSKFLFLIIFKESSFSFISCRPYSAYNFTINFIQRTQTSPFYNQQLDGFSNIL